MSAILNTCPHCSKERVSDGDWPSCKACEPILADYPAIDQIENDQARKVVMEAFQAVHKLRCDFLQELTWTLVTRFSVKPKDIPQIVDGETLLLPSWMTLRPKAMIQIENELIEQARGLKADYPRFAIGIVADANAKLAEKADEYISRFEAFLLNQRKQALNL